MLKIVPRFQSLIGNSFCAYCGRQRVKRANPYYLSRKDWNKYSGNCINETFSCSVFFLSVKTFSHGLLAVEKNGSVPSIVFILCSTAQGRLKLVNDVAVGYDDSDEASNNNKWNILADSSTSNNNVDKHCESWRFVVETNTVIKWRTVPAECEIYVKEYMTRSKQYSSDLALVANYSIAYAESLQVSDDGKDAWVFDVDETILSNLPYYAKHRYGAEAYDKVLYQAWTEEGIAPALISSHKLYVRLLKLGFKIFIITGRDEQHRNITTKNLHTAGYHSWERLILRGDEDQGKTAVVYKSKKRYQLEDEGFRLRGNIGDQWSDLTGYSVGNRTFKIPNPMYYVA